MPGADDDIALAETRATGSDEADRAAPSPLNPPGAARSAVVLPDADRDRYVIDGELARGGLGRILRAHDTHLARTVAVKEMLGGGPEAERRFVREALITARLEHPSIVPVHDAGRDARGAPFYAMKLVGGAPLSEAIAAARTTAARLALVPRILAVADAIAYAHSEGVIHRDLKPSNVLVGEFGETVVLDWGLAKELGAADEPAAPSAAGGGAGATRDGAVLGTPAYMAPEQAGGREVDARADVYALGAMLYELLAGAPPHRGKTLDEVLRQVIAGDLEPLHRRAPDVPADLAAIVAKAMAHDPEERYPSARELALDLRRYVTGQLVGVYAYGVWGRLRKWVARHKAAVAVGAIAAVVLAVFGTIAVRRIVDERDQARAARAVAVAREAEARARADELLIEQARALVDRDPTRAIAILAGLPEGSARWSAARVVAADARARGIGDVLVGHAGATADVAVDGDGDRIASVAADGIRVWDRTAGTSRLLPLPAPCAGADDCVFGRWTVALSKDGRRLLATAGAAFVWDLDAADPAPTTIEADRAWLLDDGTLIVGHLGGDASRMRIEQVDLASGKRTTIFSGAAESWIVSPGGTVVAVVPDELRIWRAGAPRVAVRGGPVRSDAVAVSASGRVIAWAEAEARAGTFSARKDETRLWVWRDGEDAPVSFPVAWPHGLAIARDDRTVTWIDELGLAWLALEPAVDLRRGAPGDADIGDELVPGPAADVLIAASDTGVAIVRAGLGRQVLVDERRDWRVAVSRDGTRIAAAGAAAVRAWAVGPAPSATASPPRVASPPGRGGPRGVVTSPEVAMSADGATIVIDWLDHPVEVWRRTGGALAREGTLAVANDADLSVSPDGAELLFVDDEGAALAPVAGGAARRLGPAELGWFGPDGAAYTLRDGATIERWTASGGARVCADAEAWKTMKVSPDGSTIASLEGGRLLRCRLATGATDAIDGVGELAPWVLGGDGGAVVGYDRAASALVVADGRSRHDVRLATAPLGVRVSPDGRWAIAVAAEGGFVIASLETGAARPVAYSGAMADEVAFLPGDVAVVAAADALLVVDLATGVHRALPIAMPPTLLSAHPDGAILAVVGADLRLWLDDLPREPAALRAWLLAATDARLAPSGDWAPPATVQ